MIGLALDWFAMHQQTEDTSDLDACGWHSISGEYHYHVSETWTNQFLGCYAAEYGCTSNDPDASCDTSATTSKRWPPPWEGWERPPRPEK